MPTTWCQDDGLTDVTSAFQGVTHSLAEVLDDVHRRGWTVKIDIKNDEYVAVGSSPHKEKLTATGRTDVTAASNLLVKVMRREFMRAPHTSAWNVQPLEQQLPQIAQAYAGASVYDPKAASAWMDLAQDCQRRGQTIRQQIAVAYTHDPVPYEDLNALREDVTKKRKITLTRAYAHHPVWSEQQMLDYRLVVDVLGHAVSGGDWGWHGTCMAFGALAPLLAESPQKALFTELLGQTAFGISYRRFGPQKIAFLDQELEKVQRQENKPGHSGVHPSQSLVPSAMPGIFSRVGALTRNQLLQMAQGLPEDQSEWVHDWPDGWSVRQLQTYGDLHREGQLMSNCFSPRENESVQGGGMEMHPAWDNHPEVSRGWVSKDTFDPTRLDLTRPLGRFQLYSLRDPDNLPHASVDPYHAIDDYSIALGRHNSELKPEYAQRLSEWAQEERDLGNDGVADALENQESRIRRLRSPDVRDSHTSASGGPAQDPNANWESGITPLQDNAYLWQRDETGTDPLDATNLSEHFRALDPGLTRMHPELARQTVVNALRSSLLGARQSPRAHAMHYQDLSHLPAGVDDPMAYWDALEQRREAHNAAQGYAPGSHKQHWAQEQQFKQWVRASHPELDDGDVQRLAKREMVHMLTEEEERILASDPAEQMTAEMVEHEAYEALKKRLKSLTKPSLDQKVDFGDDRLFHEASARRVMYHVAPDDRAFPDGTFPAGKFVWGDPDAAETWARNRGAITGTPVSIHHVDVGDQPLDEDPAYPPGVAYVTTQPSSVLYSPYYEGNSDWRATHRYAHLHEAAASGWAPGQPGKGWLTHDGRVITWNVNSGGSPHHFDAMLAEGLPVEHMPRTNQQTGAWIPHPGSAVPFDITPQGEVSSAWDPEALAPIFNVDPRLKPAAQGGTTPGFGHGQSILDKLDRTSTHHADMYPPYLASRLRPLAQVSRHADELANAAREDLLSHKGHGHHFRGKALSLGINGLGPRQVSHAWLHLAPQTSNLAVINPELAEILGHDYQTETTNRDYFKHERELAAGRDAAGYGHIGLGQFSSGLWDQYAGGPGFHPDRAATRSYAPAPHTSIDWLTQPQMSMTGWTKPYWWESTQEARDQVAKDFDRSIATEHPKDEIPFKTAAAMDRAPYLTHPTTGQRIQGAPGTSLMQHLKDTMGHESCQSVWDADYDVGRA